MNNSPNGRSGMSVIKNGKAGRSKCYCLVREGSELPMEETDSSCRQMD